MATLEHARTGDRYPLAVRTLIGRSSACQLRLPGAKVSGLHAELTWDGSRWLIHDLGSRNGTSLDGTPLPPQERRRLVPGSRIELGTEDECLVLVDASPPDLVVVADDGTMLAAQSGLLCLPSDEDAELSLYERDGTWLVEDDRGARPLSDRELVMAGGTGYRVHLPGAVQLTDEGSEPPVSIRGIALEFHVSLDEETVRLRMRHGSRSLDLKPRAHDFFLLTLARARIEDQRRDALPVSEHGWMYRNDIARLLKVDRGLINLWVHRARRQLADAGILEVGELVQRRQGAEQLRIGVPRLEVHEGA
ncbi:MAG: FHA domain-containing protein [Myxococcales bacterium]|nr:FHA domain-containing protein [Myxococcales bacterium]